jgi:hypothetical protein
MNPRIYVYKITFEEIPDWYWGVHKETKYNEYYVGSPTSHAWKWEFYTPCLQICELFPYTNEGWTEAQKVENRCIKPDLNNPLCLNEHYGSVISVEALRKGAQKTHEVIHAKKDDSGKSVHAKGAGKKGAATSHEKKDDLGKSIHAKKCGKTTSSQKWVDPLHPELGEQVAGNLVRMQKRRGYPHEKENRERVR